jgi:polysaccharide export outer membrane protein
MNKRTTRIVLAPVLAIGLLLAGCAGEKPSRPAKSPKTTLSPSYIIGPGDFLKIFVWQTPELSAELPVRPDGKITTPLVEDIQAVGKTTTELARDMEVALDKYLKRPIVTVTVLDFVGTFQEQIRVVGQAAEPQALPYREDITLLDVMIQVGGLTEFASGNRAKIIRRTEGGHEELPVRINDLINQGDISANVAMYPGDVLIIPESWF